MIGWFHRRFSAPTLTRSRLNNEEDRAVIIAFAKGDTSLREQAIAIHRRNLARFGARGNAHMEFMAEVDNPMPDLWLRSLYRKRLIAGKEEALHGN